MPGETFKEYVDSFAYGTRTDLLFKFLKNMPEEAAEEFVQSLLRALGETADDGDPQRMLDLLYEAQLAAYSPPDEQPRWVYEDAPFAPMARPLAESRVGLLTSTGHFIKGHPNLPPELAGVTHEQSLKMSGEFGRAMPVLTAIPTDTPQDQLDIIHPGYDSRATRLDRNVSFPVDRMKEAEAEGVIGEFASPAYSFIGLTSQIRLTKEVLPGWVEQARTDSWDAAVLVPV